MYPGMSPEDLRINLARFDALRNRRRIPAAPRAGATGKDVGVEPVRRWRPRGVMTSVRRFLHLRPAHGPVA